MGVDPDKADNDNDDEEQVQPSLWPCLSCLLLANQPD